MQNEIDFPTRLRWSILGAAVALAGTFAASAQQNEVSITERDGYRHFTSNGIPDHPTGSFPNRNTPNRVAPHRFPPPPPGSYQGASSPMSEPERFLRGGAYDDRRKMPEQERTIGDALGGQFAPPQRQGFESPRQNRYPERAAHGGAFRGPQTKGFRGSAPQRFHDPMAPPGRAQATPPFPDFDRAPGISGRREPFQPPCRPEEGRFHRLRGGEFNGTPRDVAEFNRPRPRVPDDQFRGPRQPPQGQFREPGDGLRNGYEPRPDDEFQGPQAGPFPEPQRN